MENRVEVACTGELIQIEQGAASSYRFENTDPSSPMVLTLAVCPGDITFDDVDIATMMLKNPKAKITISIEADPESDIVLKSRDS